MGNVGSNLSLRFFLLFAILSCWAETGLTQSVAAANQQNTDQDTVDMRDWWAAYYAHLDSLESYDVQFNRLAYQYDKSGEPTEASEMRGRIVRNHLTDEHYYVFRHEDLLATDDGAAADGADKNGRAKATDNSQQAAAVAPYRFEYAKWNGRLSEGGSTGANSRAFSIAVTPENYTSAYGQGLFPTFRMMGVSTFPVRDVYAGPDTMLSDTFRAQVMASPAPAQVTRRQDGMITLFRVRPGSEQNLTSRTTSQYDETNMTFVASSQTIHRGDEVVDRWSQSLTWGTCEGVAVPTGVILRKQIDEEGQTRAEELVQFQWNSVTPQDDAFYEPFRQLPFRSSHLSQLEAFLSRPEPTKTP